MALNIEDEATDRLARELARLTGQPITAVVRHALEAQLATVRRRATDAAPSDLGAIISRGRTRQTQDQRSDEEILGYG